MLLLFRFLLFHLLLIFYISFLLTFLNFILSLFGFLCALLFFLFLYPFWLFVTNFLFLLIFHYFRSLFSLCLRFFNRLPIIILPGLNNLVKISSFLITITSIHIIPLLPVAIKTGYFGCFLFDLRINKKTLIRHFFYQLQL